MPVQAAILNEDFIGARTGHNHSSQVDARHIALQRLRVADRQPVVAFEAHTQLAQKVEVGVVASHGKDKIVLDRLAALGCLQSYRVWSDLYHARVEVRLD